MKITEAIFKTWECRNRFVQNSRHDVNKFWLKKWWNGTYTHLRVFVWIFVKIGPTFLPVTLTHTYTQTHINSFTHTYTHTHTHTHKHTHTHTHTHTRTHIHRYPRLDSNIIHFVNKKQHWKPDHWACACAGEARLFRHHVTRVQTITRMGTRSRL